MFASEVRLVFFEDVGGCVVVILLCQTRQRLWAYIKCDSHT